MLEINPPLLLHEGLNHVTSTGVEADTCESHWGSVHALILVISVISEGSEPGVWNGGWS